MEALLSARLLPSDQPNMTPMHAEPFSQFPSLFGRFGNLFFLHKSKLVKHVAVLGGMPDIRKPIDHFQVFESIIGAIKVDVVNVHSLFDRSFKCLINETVDIFIFLFSKRVQWDLNISVFSENWLSDFIGNNHFPKSSMRNDSFKRLNSTGVRNCIFSKESMNGFKDFHKQTLRRR